MLLGTTARFLIAREGMLFCSRIRTVKRIFKKYGTALSVERVVGITAHVSRAMVCGIFIALITLKAASAGTSEKRSSGILGSSITRKVLL